MISLGAWQFNFSNPAINLACLLLLVSLMLSLRAVGQRLFQRKPFRAPLVMLLNVIAFSTVSMLLLEPQLLHPGEDSVILVTEGADPAQFFNLTGSRVYVSPAVEPTVEVKQRLGNASWLLDTAQLGLREPALASIKVLGFGLEKDQWRHFANDIQIDFKPPPVDGFTHMQWQRSLVSGETLYLSGRYQQAGSSAIIELRLLDPAANTVSESRITSGQSFSMAVRTRARGNLEYWLQAWVADKLQAEQLVPVEAGANRALSIMVDQSAPSFETRQLKNHAATYGHRVLINTRISKGKTISQTANLPHGAETTLSPQTLAMQDVLIMDGRALSQLPSMQIQWLEEAVENGLGLLLLADSALLENSRLLKADLLKGFDLSPLADAETMIFPHLLTNQAQGWQGSLAARPMKLVATSADVLINDGSNRALVVRQSRGLGHVSISLLSHTESWLTGGRRAEWSELWSALIAAIARQPGGSLLLAPANTDFFRVDQRTEICALADEENLRVSVSAIEAEGLQAAFELDLAPDSLQSSRQCAYFWPQSSGWHQINLLSESNDAVLDQSALYVFKTGQWQAQQRQKRVDATRTRAAFKVLPKTAGPPKWVSEPVSVFWLWLTLVLSATFLWLERKLDFG